MKLLVALATAIGCGGAPVQQPQATTTTSEVASTQPLGPVADAAVVAVSVEADAAASVSDSTADAAVASAHGGHHLEIENVTAGGYPMDVLYMQRHLLEPCLGPDATRVRFEIDVGRDGRPTHIQISIRGSPNGCLRNAINRIPFPAPRTGSSYKLAGELVYSAD
jgi:hypothetical protein